MDEIRPTDSQDEAPWIDMPIEEWAANMADGIMEALEVGNWRGAQLCEKLLQQAFDDGTIRKH